MSKRKSKRLRAVSRTKVYNATLASKKAQACTRCNQKTSVRFNGAIWVCEVCGNAMPNYPARTP